ncbi:MULTISPECIES: YjjG family noncanonical pyrimidine nucleotidase [unclassified Flavobacterium]|mgnify:FL=1|jgi:putative hydrolase of the HAD superfamily|uniref:YjjG family noncanonical pyrimidine nucleotidase n=2 Tax=Flavobacterium TaxID=237 RepID=UPI0010668BB9|nr:MULTISPECIES: YjjG family noncanonical pyrimidine nucleotidase [unclassified Flavobacterium]TDX08615.1 putative hydrolase of the HAD superfamily [Flavobacterium sp. S87F.05.LMB.W.Kidney.N]BDU23648.1 noncanonical pyrimidine nucleotidase, YjjG family protein [Flavobacterium sp. GSB-24]
MNTKITDIFFDLDHTLWDFDKNSEMAFDRIFKEKYAEIPTADFIKQYIPINQECWRLYQNDKITHQELRYNRLKFSFDALNYVISEENIFEIANDYIEFLTDNNYLFDGAIEVLEYLKPKYKLHIITNGFANVQEKKINNASLGGYFATITNSELAGVKKPNSIIFDYALQLANTSKENSIMIGDDFEADVNGALNAGLDAIFFNEKKLDVSGDYKQINHLLELKKYL